MTRRYETPAEVPDKVVAALDRIARGMRRHRQSVATTLGLTPLQGELLRTLAAAPPPRARVTQLAGELGVSQPTVSDSLLTLEQKGHVQRTPRSGDRRSHPVTLTASGRNLADQLQRADATLRDGVMALPEPEQGRALHLLLTVMQGLLDEGVLNTARTCLSCRYFQPSEGAARCGLLGVELPDADLRVDCAEHERRGGRPVAAN